MSGSERKPARCDCCDLVLNFDMLTWASPGPPATLLCDYCHRKC